jgi:hypothetical protein
MSMHHVAAELIVNALRADLIVLSLSNPYSSSMNWCATQSVIPTEVEADPTRHVSSQSLKFVCRPSTLRAVSKMPRLQRKRVAADGGSTSFLDGCTTRRGREHVGFLSPAALRLWRRDRKLYRLVARGVLPPHMDVRKRRPAIRRGGGRRRWGGEKKARSV